MANGRQKCILYRVSRDRIIQFRGFPHRFKRLANSLGIRSVGNSVPLAARGGLRGSVPFSSIMSGVPFKMRIIQNNIPRCGGIIVGRGISVARGR